MPFYTRLNFQQDYPDFQEHSEDLACSFDEAGVLREASFSLDSKVFGKKIKFMTLKIAKDYLEIERGSLIDFLDDKNPIRLHFKTEKLQGSKGSDKVVDKDQNETVIQWTRDGKIREALTEMRELSQRYKGITDKEEVDAYLEKLKIYHQSEQNFSRMNFKNWPENLTENRFKTWRDLTPEFDPEDFRMFFDWLKSNEQDSQMLSQDQLGASLSRYISLRNSKK